MPKKKNYFDEEKVQEMIFQYKISKDKVLEKDLIKEIQKLVLAIIFAYKYNRFEPVEDMLQHATLACFLNIDRYSKERGTVYNYFSKTAQMCLFNYTTRRKKHRINISDEDGENKEELCEMEDSFDLHISDMENELFNYVDELYTGDNRKDRMKIIALIIEYFKQNRKFGGKTDLFKWCKNYGVRQKEIKCFLIEVGNVWKKKLILII
jgi:DNA-directed RNA polymerase specialized sigma24 family protein